MSCSDLCKRTSKRCCMATTPPSSHMDKLVLARPLPCLALTGTTTWVAIRTPWVLWIYRAVLSRTVQTRWANKDSASFQDPSTSCLMAFRKFKWTMSQSNLQFIVHFCKYTTKSYMIYSKTKNQTELWALEKTNIQEYSLRDNLNMWSIMPMIAFSCLNEVRAIESHDRRELIFIHPDLILFSRFWWRVIQLMKEECCLEVNLTCVIWQEVRKSTRRITWERSSFWSSKLSIWVFHHLVKLFRR